MLFRNKIILITGAAGFIGSHLVDKCLEKGAEKVIGVDNFSGGIMKNLKHLKNEERFKLIRGDVRNFDLIKPLVQKSDYVFHEAVSKLINSFKNPRIDLETNIIGTFNILESAKESDVRIVHASTGSVFGSSKKLMDENHPKNPTTLYGISKLAGEKYCLHYAREFGTKVSVIRYFHVYGPRQDYLSEAGVVSIFLYRVLKNKPLIVYGGDQIRCFTYVVDDIDATLLLAKKNKTIGEDYNVASKVRISIKDLAELIIRKYGTGEIRPIFKEMRRGENLRPTPNTKKIERLGFKTKVSFDEGLEKTRQWIIEDMKRN